MTKIKSILAASAAIAALGLSGQAAADQVIVDDLIVNGGSLCVGLDCVSGESFGFDTLRLKENNLRIHFQDTSVSASFPTNDWRIVANDSSNGGANYLAIEDSSAGRIPFRVEAGAPNDTLYVEADGDVGIKTDSPIVDLHIVEGNTPTMRLEQDGSSGFTPQTWDVAGNEAGFFIRDATNGSQLAFRIRPGADESSIDIAANNDVGIGTGSPGEALDVLRVVSGGDATVRVRNGSAGASSSAAFRAEAIIPRLQLISTAGSSNGKQDIITLQNAGNPQIRFENLNNSNNWHLGAGNTFEIEHASTAAEVFVIDTTGNLTITGSITTGGGTCGGGCDAVFSAAYAMPSIQEHSAAMWSNGYLPNVGPTIEGEPVNMTDKVGRMLNELETAHVYIDQLHARLEAVETELAEMRD